MIRTGVSQKQRGSTLVVAMILLLVMSLLAASSLRSTVLQERMSSNAYDRNLAFQSAEAGLRMGERMADNWVKTGLPSPLPTTCPAEPNSATGRYVTPPAPANCTPLWEGPAPESSGSFWHDAHKDSGTNFIAFSSAQLSLAPFYIVELISTNALCDPTDPKSAQRCRRFRVTASSKIADGRAQVILQSIYATE